MVDTPLTRQTFGRLWNFGDPAGSEERFRDHLEGIDADDKGYRLEVRTQIARTLGLQRRFDEAHGELDSIEKELPEVEPVVRVRYLLERGRAFNSSKKPEQAIPLFTEAWELAREHGHDNYSIDAAHMLAIAEQEDVAHEWNLKALEVARTTDDRHAAGWQGALLNNIGWHYHTQGDYQAAYDNLTEAWKFRQNLDREAGVEEPTDPYLAFRWSAIKQLRFLGRVEESLAEQRELEEVYSKREKPSGFVFEEIAECLHALGKDDEARPYFARAHEILKDSWVAEDEPERIARLERLGK